MWEELFDSFGKNINKKTERAPLKKAKTDLNDISSKVKNIKLEKAIKKEIDFPFVLNEMQDLINEMDNFDKNTNQNTTKPLKNLINLELIDNLIEELKSELSKECIGLLFAEIETKRILKSWSLEPKQTNELSKLLIIIDNLLTSNRKTKIDSFYMLDLEDNKLLFTIKLSLHQFVLILNKTNTNLGYLINILKPKIIKQYIKSLK